jgi:phosphoenolpyruvate carboxykinase (GTP)
LVPLVFEAHDWAHGVLIGAAMGSETTAAATGAVGVLRRDSMAMKPFCGYNYGDYFAHWLSFDKAGAKLPKIFHVNWFRKGADGKFLWPGYGDNLRVLEWIIDRCKGTVGATETPIGYVPGTGDLHVEGLSIDARALGELLDVDAEGWAKEVADIGHYLDSFGTRTPERLRVEQRRVAAALANAGAPARKVAAG